MLTFEPKRILLVKPSALGDIMHALPVLTALRRRFPAARLTWLVNRLYEPLLRGHPHLNEVMPFDRGLLRDGYVGGALGFTKFLRRLRRSRFDLAIDLQGLFRTGVMTFASGAKVRIGLGSAREGATWFYTHRIDDTSSVQHAVDRYWRVVEALGAAGGEKEFHLPIDEAACFWANLLLQAYPRPWLAVGVGARWDTKRWLPEHFAALTQRALDQFGGTAIFIGSPDEALLAEQAASKLRGPVVNLTGKTSLPRLAALLSKVDAMLGNDTGPLHLAVALGRPVVAPYTCTLTARTGPYGPRHRAVETNVPCKGSYIKHCDRMDCMAELTPERLWPALHDLLNTWQQKRHSA